MRTREFDKIKPYTYILTRKLDNKKYHGVRFGNIKLGLTPNQDFGKKYFGSSAGRFCKDFKLKPENYFFKLIWTFDHINEALSHEKKFNKQILKNKNWENKNAFPAIQYDVHPLLGKKPSKETRLKISKANKGKKASLETKAKLSRIRRGRKLSQLHIENIKKGNLGLKRSFKTRQKVRLANLGKKHSKETRLKMSLQRKGIKKSEAHKSKLIKNLKKFYWKKNHNPWNKGKKGLQVAWNKGKKFSMESRMKMSLSQKGKIPWNKGKKGLQVPWNKGKKGLQVPWNKGKKGLQVAWNKGKKFSMDSRMKMSLSHKGKIPWNKGLKGVMIAWNKGKRFKKNIYATT
tara:strand:+ start:14 stop:1048 length:1035 start_codon:yes stop_codon:yes gene_type:complete